MSEQENIAPAVEQTNEQPGTQPEVTPAEETIGSIINEPEASKEEMVPLSKFLELKNESKASQRELKALKKTIEEGATKSEVSRSMQEIADQHGVDADFLNDFVKAVREDVKKETEQEIESKLKPIAEKEKASKINETFKEHFSKAMEAMPEFNGVVKEDVIKSLSFIPANANKTFSQLIEETYGHLVQGRRSIDSQTNKAGKNDFGEIDTNRAKVDQKYFKEIMDNPVLKKKYNEGLTSRLTSQL